MRVVRLVLWTLAFYGNISGVFSLSSSQTIPISGRSFASRMSCLYGSSSVDPTEENNGDGPNNPIRRTQETIMEQLSLAGADKIAKMDVSERAKRAMLAEAIEDRIFDLTDVLESLFDEHGYLPERNREKSVQIARQTKALQIQYEELVSGNPSTVLNSFEHMMDKLDDAKE